MKERGSAAVIMMGIIVVAAAVMLGAARMGAAVVARARADTAADAAALAAADMLALGHSAAVAKAAAGETAAANGAQLVSCDCGGRFATVKVEFEVGVLGAVAHGDARAEVLLGGVEASRHGLTVGDDAVVAEVREQRLGSTAGR